MERISFQEMKEEAAPGCVVSEVTQETKNRHLQIANLLCHSNGQLLLVCRWDDKALSEKSQVTFGKGELLGNSAEGDCSNEQVLFFSQDHGRSFQIANDGQSILTLALGTSFERPSAITHAFLREDKRGRTWLYYTINQPMTCGENQPWRATGGGEIRRVELAFDGKTWRTREKSEIVLHVFAPLPYAGGTTRSVRMACLNPAVSLEDGSLLMPISGRDTCKEPRGRYWKENRCWVLRSLDDGESWTPYFVGGSNALCLCECTLTQLSDGSIYALMRAGYGTGRCLYASRSMDGGKSFTPPEPTGLPNTVGGVKPFLMKLQSGRYLLLQTDEHETAHRLNVTAFVTDEAGLLRNHWLYKRVLCCDCREKWQGSAYPTAVQEQNGVIHIAFAGFTQETNRMYCLNVEEGWLCGAVYEPAGGMLLGDDAVPRWTKCGLFFRNTRSRAQAGRFGLYEGECSIRMIAEAELYPQKREFDLIGIYSACGSQKEIAVTLCEEGICLRDAGGMRQLSGKEEHIALEIELQKENRYIVKLNGVETEAMGAAFGAADTLLTGGVYDEGEPIGVWVKEFAYG